LTDMALMFFECKNLNYLNLSTFITTNVQTIKQMFAYSGSLRYLNLYLFDIKNHVDIEDKFAGLRDDTIYCIRDQDTINYLLPPEKHRYVFCGDECYYLNEDFKIDFDDKKCLESCSDNNKLEYKNECRSVCPSNTLLYNNNLCIDHDCSKYAEYSITCVDDKPLGYYKDENGVYQKCFELCKSCDGAGNEANHNCNQCIDGYIFLNDKENDKNCYRECEHYYYYGESNVYKCTENKACPSPYNLLVPLKKKCIDQCEKDNIYIYEYHQTCLDHEVIETTYLQNIVETTIPETTYREKEIPESTQIENAKLETTAVEEIKPETTHINNVIPETNPITTKKEEPTHNDGLYDCLNQNRLINKCFKKNSHNNTLKYNIITTDILASYSGDSLKSLVFAGENGIIYQITNAKYEAGLLNSGYLPDDYDLPIIDLGECEALLKQEYNIDEKDSLIIIKKEREANKTSEKGY